MEQHSVAIGSGDPGLRGRQKIAYIKRGLFSYSNVRTLQQLQKQFPEYEIEIIDVVNDVLRKNERLVAVNFFCILRQYWREILARRQTIRLAFYRTPFIFGEIRRLIRKELEKRADEFAFSLQTQSLYDASVPGIPHFVYTDHTHLVNLRYPGFPSNELFSHAWIDLEREIYRNANHVFVMSEHVRRSLIEQYSIDPSRATTIYAGSNVDPAPVELANDQFRNQTVLFVGVDWERKGGPCLINAFHLVREKLPNARLVVVGCDPGVAHSNIDVIGKVSRDEVKRRLVQASVLCLPTRVEPFGIAPIEAFYHKLPVVASRIGALPGFVHDGQNGRLVAPDDPRALADALIELLSDPDKCRRFGERGYEVVREHYSWDAVGRKLRAGILAELASEARAEAA